MSIVDEIRSWILPVGTVVIIIVIQILVRGWSPPSDQDFLFPIVEEEEKKEEETKEGETNEKLDKTKDFTEEEKELSHAKNSKVTETAIITTTIATNQNQNQNNNNNNDIVTNDTVNEFEKVVDTSKDRNGMMKTNNNDKDTTSSEKNNDNNSDQDQKNLFAMNANDNNNTGWRCACEGGFLPPGMLKSFGSAEAMIRLGTGQCYHKQA